MKRVAVFLGLALLVLSLLGVSSAANVPLAGSLDRSFGSRGVVTNGPGSGDGIALQPDGKIVVVASGSLVRYLRDGSLDSSFGDGGYVATGFSADAVALQPDGKIVVAGASGPVSASINSEFAVARYDPNGSSDTSFGTDGITKTVILPAPPPYTPEDAGATALAFLHGGEILAAGSVALESFPPQASRFALVEYRSDGSLNPAFGDGGIVQTGFVATDVLSGIAVQADGKIVATGSGSMGGHGGLDIAMMALARYETDGSLDPTFGTAGKVTEVTTNPNLYYYGGPSAFQHGKILVAGTTSKNSYTWFPVLARFEGNGHLDSTFGQQGFAEIKRQLGAPTAMLAQKDGKILIAESSSQQGRSAVVRLLPNGRLDTSFGRGGIVSFSGGVSSLALQTDRKILVGGGSSTAWTLARLLGGDNCVVPNLRGKTVSKANAKLERSYCRTGHISTRFSSKVARGRVISTAPQRGARLPGGARIHLVVSKGKRS